MVAVPATPSVLCRLVPSGRLWLYDDDLGVTRGPSYALIHDARGYLWIGSERGPIRFDGLAWETPAGLASLSACIVRGFAPTPQGALWVATDNAGLACIDLTTIPSRITAHLTTADGLPSDTVGAVCVDSMGQVWAATNGGVALIREGRVERCIAVEDGLPSERAWTLCCDPLGRIWVGTKGGLAVVDNAAVTRVDTAGPGGEQRGVHVVACDADGRVVIGLVGGAISRVDATEQGWALTPLMETGTRVRAICPTDDGRLWVGTGAGVVALRAADGTVMDRWTEEDGLPVQGVWALARDDDGRVWASTSAGVALLAQPAPLAHPLPAESGAPRGLVFACASDGQGRMWIGSEQGLMAVDAASAGPAALPPLPALLAGQMVWALLQDTQGHMWVGTDRAGLLCLDPATGAVRAHLAADGRVPALCLQEDGAGAGRLWASVAGAGLLCIDVSTHAILHQVGRAEGLPHDVVYGLHADDAGQLWAGTWSGDLARLDGQDGTVLDTLTLNDAQGQRPVMDLTVDATGRLWAATYGGGLVHIDRATRAVVGSETTPTGAPSDLLYACLAAPDGALWVGTARGVARYLPEERRWAVVGRGLGLPNEECNARALYLDARAQLWVGTVGGVGVVDTTRVAADTAPCPVALTSLTVLGQERTLSPDLEIEDSEYDLLFSYGAVAFTGAAQVIYRVHLQGLEADWSAPTTQRTARYTNLRPGRYTFRVAARDWGGHWSAPATTSFRVIRNRQAQEMDEALERERIDKEVYRATADRLGELNARLQELNRQLEETDQLKTTLIQQTQAQAALFERLARQDGLTGLLNRRALDARLAEEGARARRRGGDLSVALLDLDHFKCINDTYGHQVGDQVLKTVARLCQETLRQEDSVGRYGGEEIALLLPTTTMVEGAAVCARLRGVIADHDWEQVAAGLHVTASIGLAVAPRRGQPEVALAAADAALYQAKAQGRDRVVCAGAGAGAVDANTGGAYGPGDAPAAGAIDVSPQHRPYLAAPAEPRAELATPAVPFKDSAGASDDVTGLDTYCAFQRELARAVACAQRRGEALALARLDLDAFKALNRAHGRAYGDAVLGGLAAVLRGGRAEDRAFRLGGDTFALILPRTDLADAMGVVERVRAQAARCLTGVTLSVGVTALTDDTRDGDDLLDHAEAALEEAKQRGRNLVVPFDPVDEQGATVPPATLAAVRRLLAEGDIGVVFQPIWDLPRGAILAYEALMRPAPGYHLSGPQEAFAVAERLGQVHTLDALCRRAILQTAGTLPPEALLFLNVTPHSLDHGLLAGSQLVDEVTAAGLTPARVVLEITERSVARPGVVVREARRLRALGFGIALDDTGAGNAGLEMLSQMPVDYVKIDRGVVAGAVTNAPARAVLAGILAIARETGAYVIAEGIETDDELRLVRRMGTGRRASTSVVRGAQGYLLGRPSATVPTTGMIEQHRVAITAA